jgi:crotonobetainyl-CoA:carnitine CoA-transferase CaiB-like acyl-CoA transferase
LTTEEAFSHPHFIARGMISKAFTEEGGSLPQLNTALPFRSDKAHQAGKGLGADTYTIMNELGFDNSEVNDLKAKRIIK